MAQQINLPISVTYSAEIRRWEVCTVEVLEAEVPIPDTLVVPQVNALEGIVLRLWRGNSPVKSRIQPFLPIDLDSAGYRAVFTQNAKFQVVASFGSRGARREANAWDMRKQFIELEESHDSLAKFLTSWGDWDAVLRFETYCEDIHEPDSALSADETRLLLAEDIFALQHFFRWWMSARRVPPAEWLSRNAAIPLIHPLPVSPFVGATDTLCLKALLTTVTLDKLRRIRFRTCARRDCKTVFELTSEHKRKYCTHECAHLASVRRTRAKLSGRAIDRKSR